LRSDLVAALPLAQEIFTSSTPPEAHPEREATIVTIGIHPPLWSGLPMALRHCAAFLKILGIRNWSG
jgi:hypothetical protein